MRIGVLGGGQLGRMLALAGLPLGHTFSFYDTSAEAPARETGSLTVGSFDDVALLTQFASSVDVVTFEFENVPLSAARICAAHAPLHPSLRALEVGQDRLREKSFFQAHGIATPRFARVTSSEELTAAATEIGIPGVVKTATLGYDGKGQRVVRSTADLAATWQALGGSPLIYEEFIPFERELSLIAVRSEQGDQRFYPLAQNVHEQGILRTTTVPAHGDLRALQHTAERYVSTIMQEFNYVGVFTLELFQKGDTLYANEMAPRVHNSGHWSIEGALTSQFENHIRAITGLPLGSTALRTPSVMVNLIGTIPSASHVLSVPDAHLHLYGKAERPLRKVGHITLSPATEQNVALTLALL